MLIFLILSIFLSVFLIDFYNYFQSKRRLINCIFPLAIFASSQFILSIFFQTFNPTYNLIKILSFIVTFLVLLGIILFIIFSLIVYARKNKQSISIFNTFKNMITNNWLMYLSILIFGILLIFVTNDFADTGYYLNLSTKFTSNDLSDFKSPYRYSLFYYYYASVSSYDEIPSFYNFLTPFAFYLISISFVNELIDYKIKSNKNIIAKIFVNIVYLLLSLAFIPTTISGNMFIQANLILLVIVSLITKKYYQLPLILLMGQFFSITGFILSLIIITGLLVYGILMIKINNIFNFFVYWSLTFTFLGPCIPISLGMSINAVKIFNILFMIASIVLFIVFISLNKQLSTKFEVMNHSLFSSKVFTHNYWYYLISCLTIVANVIILLCFIKFYSYSQYYSWPLMLVSSIILEALIIWFIFKNKNNDSNSYFVYFVIFCVLIVGLLSLILIVTKLDNASIWRITYSSISLPLPESSLFIFIFSCLLIGNIYNDSRLSLYIYDRKIALMSSKQKNIIISLLLLVCTGFSIIPVAYAQKNTDYKLELTNFSANITNNVNIFDKYDFNVLEQLNEKAKNQTFASDNMASMYLTQLDNLSFNVAELIYKNYKLIDDRYWAYNRLNFFNAKINNPGISNVNLDEFISLMQGFLNESNNWGVDYLILSKKTPYYNSLDFSGLNKQKFDAHSFVILY